MGGGESKTPRSFIFGGSLSSILVERVFGAGQNLPLNFFSRDNMGFGYVNTICVLKMFVFSMGN